MTRCRKPSSSAFPRSAVLAASIALAACGSAKSTADAGVTDVRNTRYCEILVGFMNGTAVHIDVYSTEGLNDCPESAWSMVNATQVSDAFSAAVVVLNGPRYWTIDSFGDSMLLNTTPTMVGGIEMRQAGAIDTQLGDVAAMEAPYNLHTINRDSEFIWDAGLPVFELLDPQGHVYTMQSYTLQKDAQQTIDTLASLGSVLKPPAGWSWRTRVLTEELDVKAVNELATVTTDDYLNTYLQTQ